MWGHRSGCGDDDDDDEVAAGRRMNRTVRSSARRWHRRRRGVPRRSPPLAALASSAAMMAVLAWSGFGCSLDTATAAMTSSSSAAFVTRPVSVRRREASHRSSFRVEAPSAFPQTDVCGGFFLGPTTTRRRNLVIVVASSSSSSSKTSRSSPSVDDDVDVQEEAQAQAQAQAPPPDASDLEGIRLLYFTHCDPDGLMTLSTLRTSVGPIRELLDDGELLPEELDDAWQAAVAGKDDEQRIDVDGFVRIYRDIDDLFEDDDDDDDNAATDAEPEVGALVDGDKEEEDEVEEGKVSASSVGVEDVDDDDAERRELLLAFEHLIAGSEGGLLSREALRGWEEVDQLVSDGLLSEGEFDDIWTSSATKSADGEMMMNPDGFLAFNAELDGLFEDEEDDDDDEVEEGTTAASKEVVAESSMAPSVDVVVTEEGLPPAEIFARIANDDFLVGLDDIRTKWGELAEMLESGDLSGGELRGMFDDVPAAKGTTGDGGGAPKMIDEDGFVRLYEAIDDLFEDEDDGDDDEGAGGEVEPPATSTSTPGVKEELLDLIDQINREAESQDQLTCGVSDEVPTDGERAAVLETVGRLEKDEDRNRILRGAEAEEEITELDLAGEWELLYTSSAMMRFNNGLSGLGGSVPNGKFGGLRQTLRASRYLSDVEYTERIAVNPDVSSFDVKVTGDWELKRSVSLLLGVPTVVMSVEPDKVTYGPTRTRADHWKSVRAMNLLDVTYLDDDLRVMRGSTSTDTLFIFRRV